MRYVLDTTAFSAAMGRDLDLLKLIKKHQPGDIVTALPSAIFRESEISTV
jgi:hypothetical protein